MVIGAELGEVTSLRILGVTFDSKLTLQMHLRQVVSKAARNLGVVRRAGKLFDCPLVLQSCFNAYVLSSLIEVLCPHADVSVDSLLGLLDSIVRGAERLCKGLVV